MTAADGGTGDTAALWFIVWHDGAAIGACAIFPTVGAAWPFYSYRRDRVRTVSQALGRSITLATLAPRHPFDGAAEVGEIGRASCRARVCQYVSISVFAVSLQNKQQIKAKKIKI